MPINLDQWGCPNRSAQIREAERQVLAKFPDIIVGSSGWHRAVANRIRRIR